MTDVKRTFVLAVAAASMAVAAPALAHHGWGSYDATKTTVVEGRVEALSWVNPHGEIQLSHDGKPWRIVLAPLNRMEARGLDRDMIAVGRTVKVEGYPRHDGTAEMRIERITAAGKTVELR